MDQYVIKEDQVMNIVVGMICHQQLDDVETSTSSRFIQDTESTGPRSIEKGKVFKIKKEFAISDCSLIQSIDGREFITSTKLKQEIVEHLKMLGGRISLKFLSEHVLNVGLHETEELIQQIIISRESCTDNEIGQVFLMNNEVFTSFYIDRLNQELLFLIQDKKIVSIEEVCQYASGLLIKEFILKHFQKFLEAQNLNDQLLLTHSQTHFYTKSYVMLLKAKLKGRLRATSRPILIKNLLAFISSEHVELQHQDIHNESSPFYCDLDLCKEIILSLESVLPGKILGKGIETSLYMPNIYQDHQEGILKSTWLNTGRVEKSDLKRVCSFYIPNSNTSNGNRACIDGNTSNNSKSTDSSYAFDGNELMAKDGDFSSHFNIHDGVQVSKTLELTLSLMIKEGIELSQVYVTSAYLKDWMKELYVKDIDTNRWLDFEEKVEQEFCTKSDTSRLIQFFREEFPNVKVVSGRFLILNSLVEALSASVEKFVIHGINQQRRTSSSHSSADKKSSSRMSITTHQITSHIQSIYRNFSGSSFSILIEELTSSILFSNAKRCQRLYEEADQVFMTPTLTNLPESLEYFPENGQEQGKTRKMTTGKRVSTATLKNQAFPSTRTRSIANEIQDLCFNFVIFHEAILSISEIEGTSLNPQNSENGNRSFQSKCERHLLETTGQEIVKLIALEEDENVSSFTSSQYPEHNDNHNAHSKDLLEASVEKLRKALRNDEYDDFLSVVIKYIQSRQTLPDPEDPCTNQNETGLQDITMKNENNNDKNRIFPDYLRKEIEEKKEKMIENLKQQLSGHSVDEDRDRDHALTLHIVLVLLFFQFTSTFLNVSGKFVPALLKHLQPKLKQMTVQMNTEHVSNAYDLLRLFQKKVIQLLKLKSTNKGEERNQDKESVDTIQVLEIELRKLEIKARELVLS